MRHPGGVPPEQATDGHPDGGEPWAVRDELSRRHGNRAVAGGHPARVPGARGRRASARGVHGGRGWLRPADHVRRHLPGRRGRLLGRRPWAVPEGVTFTLGMSRGLVRALAVVCAIAVVAMGFPAGAIAQPRQAPPPAAQVTPDPWPRTFVQGGARYSLYQPQLDSWDGFDIEAHAAVSVVAAGAKAPTFGVIELSAKTTVDRASRTVRFTAITVKKATFPSAPQLDEQYRSGFQAMATGGRSTMSLDRLEAMLAIEGAEKKARAVPIRNEPPTIVFSKTAAVLVPIDGEPAWRPVPGTGLERVINTRPLVLRDTASGTLYLHLPDGFLEARALAGPSTRAASVPSAVTATAATLSKEGIVDLMTGPTDEKDPAKKPSL